MERHKEETVDTAVSKWGYFIEQNERAFEQSVDQLKQYEGKLVESIKKIEAIEQISVAVKKTYIENHERLKDVTEEQGSLIYQLDAIDKELDILLHSSTHESS